MSQDPSAQASRVSRMCWGREGQSHISIRLPFKAHTPFDPRKRGQGIDRLRPRVSYLGSSLWSLDHSVSIRTPSCPCHQRQSVHCLVTRPGTQFLHGVHKKHCSPSTERKQRHRIGVQARVHVSSQPASTVTGKSPSP